MFHQEGQLKKKNQKVINIRVSRWGWMDVDLLINYI